MSDVDAPLVIVEILASIAAIVTGITFFHLNRSLEEKYKQDMLKKHKTA